MDKLREASTTRPVTVETRGLTLSGLATSPMTHDKGLVVALHGAGYSSGYWSYANRGELSLLELGASLGFHVFAPDRPGYLRSYGVARERCRLEDQVETLFEAISNWRQTAGVVGPTYLIGHSVGAALCLLMGGHDRAHEIQAVDVLGVPYRFASSSRGSDSVREMVAHGTHIPPINDQCRRAWLYGPDGTFDPHLQEFDRTLITPIPLAEYQDSMLLPNHWQLRLPTIRIPVQYTVAEHEVMQDTGVSILRDVERLMQNCPRLETRLQRHSGHNASMAYVATAYHLRAFAFFFEVATPAARQREIPRGDAPRQ